MTTMDHEIAAKFDTYEDYLDSLITQEHLYYLGSRDTARQLFEIGCLCGSEVMGRAKFELKKQELLDQKTTKRSAQVPLAHLGGELANTPLVQKLAELEDDVRSGQKTVLIFIRGENSNGQEVSAYIDYGDRLRTEDWHPFFQGKRLLKPKITDVSFYNWKTRTTHHNESSNFEVKAENEKGMIFVNKKDMKEFSLDPADAANPGDNTVRYDIEDPNYTHCVVYVHSSRRKQ